MGFIINPYQVQPSGPSYGTLTTAWITATGETDATILGALNTLESDLTTYGLTSKMKALYPFVGGTSTKHSYNFMNTAAFQITWFGGVTHDSNGITGNGTNSYGNTGFIASSQLTNFESMGIYVRTNVSENKYDIGSFNGATATIINSRDTSNQIATTCMDGTLNYATSITDSRGFVVANRTTTTDKQIYKNTTKYSATNLQGGYSTVSNYILAYNGIGTPTAYSSRNLAFAYFANTLTDTEESNLYTAVQAFQTTLSRNV